MVTVQSVQAMGQTNQYKRDYDNSYKIARLMTKINDNTITSLHMKVTHNQLKVIEYAWGLSQWQNLGKTAKNERVYKQVDMSKWRPGYKRGSDYDSGHACKFNKITRNQWESTSNWLSDITLSEWSQNRKKIKKHRPISRKSVKQEEKWTISNKNSLAKNNE